jgi:GH3 auxin-responsive promoter
VTRGVEAATARLLGPAVRTLTAASALRFARALETPEAAQRERLKAVLRAVSGSRQADRIPGFDRIATAREFQDAVPLRRPDEFGVEIAEIARGARGVLTRDPPLRFERSGGSSGASKLVPHTRSLLGEFQAALQPWIHDLARARPRAFEGPGYWSVSPLAQESRVTEGGIRVGGDDDGAYFPGPLSRMLSQVFAVPGAVARLPDVSSCRYVTLRLLLQCPELAFASVWNPSFLTLLIDSLDANAERLIDDLAAGTCRPPAHDSNDGASRNGGPAAHERIERVVSTLPLRADPARARRLRALLDSGRLEPERLWPKLALLSVWADAQATRSLTALRERFPSVEYQGKGLLATEGVISIPWFDAPAPVLAVRSHFLEFIDPRCADDRPVLAHELETGRDYEVVLSNGAGLLRYRLGDRVRVVARHAGTPCIRFEGRADAVSDLVGEKLSAQRVRDVLSEVVASDAAIATLMAPPRFVLLAPEWGAPPAYCLYLESEEPDLVLDACAIRVDAALCAGYSYGYARSLGQLGPVRAVRVRDGAHRYEARCVALGQRAGDVKPAELDLRTGWSEWMSVDARNAARIPVVQEIGGTRS